MKATSKVICLVLCCAMGLSLTGCRLNTPANVLTVDGVQIPAGLYLIYQLQAHSSAVDLQADKEVNVLKDTLDGKTGEAWIHEETLRLARRYVTLDKQFTADGLTLTADEQSSAEAQSVTSYTSNAAMLQKNGIGQDSYTKFYLNEAKYDKLFTAYSAKNGTDITDAAAKAHMDKIYTHVATLMLPTTDTAGVALATEDAAKVQAIADKLAKTLAAGGSMDALAETALKDAFTICGLSYTDDALAQFQSTTFISEKNSYFDAETTATMQSAKVGEAATLPYNGVPMVYQKIANYTDDADFTTNFRSTIVNIMCQETFDAQLKTDGAAYAVTEDAAAVKAYAPQKIVLA